MPTNCDCLSVIDPLRLDANAFPVHPPTTHPVTHRMDRNFFHIMFGFTLQLTTYRQVGHYCVATIGSKVPFAGVSYSACKWQVVECSHNKKTGAIPHDTYRSTYRVDYPRLRSLLQPDTDTPTEMHTFTVPSSALPSNACHCPTARSPNRFRTAFNPHFHWNQRTVDFSRNPPRLYQRGKWSFTIRTNIISQIIKHPVSVILQRITVAFREIGSRAPRRNRLTNTLMFNTHVSFEDIHHSTMVTYKSERFSK